MQNTQHSIIRLIIHIVMLVGLLAILPERSETQTNLSSEENAKNNVISQDIRLHRLNHASKLATTLHSTQQKQHQDTLRDKPTTFIQFISKSI